MVGGGARRGHAKELGGGRVGHDEGRDRRGRDDERTKGKAREGWGHELGISNKHRTWGWVAPSKPD